MTESSTDFEALGVDVETYRTWTDRECRGRLSLSVRQGESVGFDAR